MPFFSASTIAFLGKNLKRQTTNSFRTIRHQKKQSFCLFFRQNRLLFNQQREYTLNFKIQEAPISPFLNNFSTGGAYEILFVHVF